ncbi:hypothetical protein VIGAN_06091800 [Vigna angularis var. angularis]|uniref:Uncharacterized protein n=1 Tax=Vigna angularis var. angularis TaxID=157739 RepID=A0A0S3SAM4_PHAAN|nr:hypothetical protein VIGAN_06091800 [Vigna angularis var. angularis]
MKVAAGSSHVQPTGFLNPHVPTGCSPLDLPSVRVKAGPCLENRPLRLLDRAQQIDGCHHPLAGSVKAVISVCTPPSLCWILLPCVCEVSSLLGLLGCVAAPRGSS